MKMFQRLWKVKQNLVFARKGLHSSLMRKMVSKARITNLRNIQISGQEEAGKADVADRPVHRNHHHQQHHQHQNHQ